jgi:hypothetical protein
MEIKGKLLDTEDVDGMKYKFKISAHFTHQLLKATGFPSEPTAI